LIEKEGLTLTHKAQELVESTLQKMATTAGFANGRDIGNLVAEIRTSYARRLYGVDRAKGDLSTEVIEADVEAMIGTIRKNMAAASKTSSLDPTDESNQIASDTQDQGAKVHNTIVEEDAPKKEEKEEKVQVDDSNGGPSGVKDASDDGSLSDSEWGDLKKAAHGANLDWNDVEKGAWRNNKDFENSLEKQSKNPKVLLDKLGATQAKMQHKLEVQQKEEKEIEKKLKAKDDLDSETLQKLKDEKKKRKRIQQKLREMGVCEAGYEWIRDVGGWRCAGGSHFVTDHQLM